MNAPEKITIEAVPNMRAAVVAMCEAAPLFGYQNAIRCDVWARMMVAWVESTDTTAVFQTPIVRLD